MINKKGDKWYIKWKGYNLFLNFPKPYSLYNNVKVELELSSYAPRSDVKKLQVFIDHHLEKMQFR